MLLSSPRTWAVCLTLAYLVILAVRPAESWFGVPGQWTWSGRPPSLSTLPRWPPAIAVLLVMLSGGLLLDRRWQQLKRYHHLVALCGLATLIPISQLALKYIHYRYPMEYYLFRTIGPHNGFWQASVAIESLLDYLKTYPDQMRAMRGIYVHLPVHPPGNVLYLWGWRKLFEWLPQVGYTVAHWFRGYNCADVGFVTLENAQIASALGQIAVLAFSGLTILPLYVWTSDLADRQTAWRACVLYSFTPALGLFSMRWDSVYPLFSALAFALIHRGIVTKRVGYWFAGGLAVSIASFCSFGNATLAPAVALYAALHLLDAERDRLLATWPRWLALIAGGYAVWGVYHLLTGVTVWEIFTVTLETHLNLGRTYWPWIFYNLYDLAVFAGIGTTALCWQAIHRVRYPRRSLYFPFYAAISVILLMNFSGVVRGEVGRMWLPWAPVLCLTAAIASKQLSGWALASLAAALVALQSLWMALFLRVSPTGMPGYVPRPVTAVAQAEPKPDRPFTILPGAAFQSNIELVGYDIPEEVQVGSNIDVALYWSASQRPDLPYTVFVHIADKDGEVIAQHDAMPANNQLPTSCWLDGELVKDTHRLQLPDDVAPGDYVILVGLYYLPTMDRLQMIAGDNVTEVIIPLRVVQSTISR